MRRLVVRLRCASVLAAAVGAACQGSGATTAAADEARAAIRIVVVSHGQSSDPFWSVVANGINDAAKDLGVRAEYQAPTSFDMTRMSELIDAVSASRPNALVVSIPDPASLGEAIRGAVRVGIPTMGVNSGADAWQGLGLLGYVGQTEYEAGFGAGEHLADAGATRVLCVNHEVGNLSLDERCRGLDDAMRRAGGSSTVLSVDLADPDDMQRRVSSALTGDRALDGILTLGPTGSAPTLAALQSIGKLGAIHFGTFDLESSVLRAVESGEILFAIDQQPYLQGYLAIVLMTKYLETGTMAGGGDVVRTGPSFVTRENVGDVIRLTEQGIR